MEQRITPNLWFDTEAEEAADFYTSVFKNSRIVNVTHYTEARRATGRHGDDRGVRAGRSAVRRHQRRPPVHVRRGRLLPDRLRDQDEVDYYWERLSEGGEEGPCGWLKDKFGLSWQVVPTGMEELFTDPDPERAKRAMQAMLEMGKLDIAALRSAADGVPAS